MKDRNEITNKIDALMEAYKQAKRSGADKGLLECMCCQIDALLWVIDDRSGAPLLDERAELF